MTVGEEILTVVKSENNDTVVLEKEKGASRYDSSLIEFLVNQLEVYRLAQIQF